MIIKGSSRAGAAGLSKHLQNAKTNERVTLQETSWTLAKDITGALHEMDAIAAGGRCKAFMYHAQINPKADEHLTPEQWQKAVDTLEKNLGLEGHQRVVVEHVKDGRQHYHVVWNRLDVETLKSVSMSWNYRTHELTARQLEKEFQLERVQGVHVEREEGKTRGADTPERWEFEHGQKSGLDPLQIKAEVSELWRASKTGQEFAAALEESGYILAKGDRRDFCIIDEPGDYHSLARRLEGVKAAEVREHMKDVDRASLPTVAEAKEMQSERQQQREIGHGQKSGLNPRQIKAEVSELWSVSKTGQEFAAALEEHGYLLAKGDRRDFVIIDERGGEYSAARATGSKVAEVRERMKDINRAALPSVEAAKTLQEEQARKREQEERVKREQETEDFEKQKKREAMRAQVVDTVCAVWKESGYNGLDFLVSIQHKGLYVAQDSNRFVVVQENGFMHGLSAKQYGETAQKIQEGITATLKDNNGLILPTVEECRATLKERHEEEYKALKISQSSELGKTQADIRLAYTLTKGGQAFADALADKGLILARVTDSEAQASIFEDGELVVVNVHGAVNRLNTRTTGAGKSELIKRLSLINRDELFTLSEAKEEQYKALKISQSSELGKTQADIRLAYALTKGGQAFANALEDKGLILARVTDIEVQDSITLSCFYSRDMTKDFAPPILKEGELVVVNAHGAVYRLNARTTGDDKSEMIERLSGINRADLLTLREAKETVYGVKQHRKVEKDLEQIKRDNKRQAMSYPIPHPHPPWEAEAQKITPPRDERPRPQHPADHARSIIREREEKAKREREEQGLRTARDIIAREAKDGRTEQTDRKEVRTAKDIMRESRTEQTDRKQVMTAKDIMRESKERQSERGERERGDDEERKRKQERERER
ncbi:MAG: relaxase/mobilization nuclease domain-containing protein [Nitrospirae bacterium]|nr:relaxase/mobilization nuclease domain-containing protein [Nitrospirota bacterium]